MLIITGVTIDHTITKQKQDQAEQRANDAAKGRESAEKAKADAEADRDAKAAESAEKQRQIDDLTKQLQAKADAKRNAANVASISGSSTTAGSIRSGAIAQNVIPTVNAVGCSFYEPLVAQYPWNVSTMMRIMNAESSCNPNKMNYADHHATCNGSYGLFQIGCIHGVTDVAMADPAANIAQAYAIYLSQGYGAWSTY